MELDIRARRAIGPYILIPEPGFNLWLCTRPDGQSIPKDLVGKWTSIHDFKQVYLKVHGAENATSDE